MLKQIEEKLKMKLKINAIEKYVDEIVIEFPKGMSDQEFQSIINTVEKESSNMKDMARILEERYEFKVESKEVKPAYSINRDFKINFIGQVE